MRCPPHCAPSALAPAELPASSISSAVDEQLDALHGELYQQGSLARLHAHQILYGEEHPLGSSLNNSVKTLQPLTVDQQQERHRIAFAPEQSALVVVGALDRATPQPQLERAFAQLPANGRVLLGPAPRASESPVLARVGC